MSKVDDMILALFKKNKIKYVDGPSKKLAALTYGKAIFKNPRPVFDLIRATEQAIEFYIDSDNNLAYRPKFQDDSYPKRGDIWGPLVEYNVTTAHSAGTTIVVTPYTVPSGKEAQVHYIGSDPSRVPDASNVAVHYDAADALIGYLINESTSGRAIYPSTGKPTTDDTYEPAACPVKMYAGDYIKVSITNNAQAGDTNRIRMLYQERDV